MLESGIVFAKSPLPPTECFVQSSSCVQLQSPPPALSILAVEQEDHGNQPTSFHLPSSGLDSQQPLSALSHTQELNREDLKINGKLGHLIHVLEQQLPAVQTPFREAVK